MFISCARELKKALHDKLMRAALSRLLSTMSKLANQTARLLAIPVKRYIVDVAQSYHMTGKKIQLTDNAFWTLCRLYSKTFD